MGSVTLPLSRGGQFTVDDDVGAALRHKRVWKDSCGYPTTSIDGLKVRIHRYVMGDPSGMSVDHINGDTLDNRRSNLRVCTHKQNIHNSRAHIDGSSRYKGVSFCNRTRRWTATLVTNGRHVWLGRFLNEEDAARAVDKKAIELRGEFARLNFPLVEDI